MILRNILIALNAISDVAQGLLRGMGSGPRNHIMPAPLYALIYARISRTEHALRGLAERMARLGRVPVRRSVAGVVRARQVRAPKAVVPPDHPWEIPRRRGWLLFWAPGHAGHAAARLRAVLDAPEMAALLAESAQARRLVRTLCFALGIRDSEIGHDRRAAEIRGIAAWQGPAVSDDERWVADAWALIWARAGEAGRAEPAGVVETG